MPPRRSADALPAPAASVTPPEPPAVSAAASAAASAAVEPAADSPDAFRRRPRQSRGQKRVELLLDAAAAVIAEHGLEGATAEAIAQQARTAKGSLYQFFPNRDAVIAGLALRYADEMRAIHERAFPLDAHELPLEQLIDRIVRPLAEFHDRNPAFRRVFASHEGPTDDTRSAPSRLRSQLFESFVDRLDVLFAARNPALANRDRRRAALVAATIGQGLLRARALSSDKKALLDELRRVLMGYLGPLLEPAEERPRRGRKNPTPTT